MGESESKTQDSTPVDSDLDSHSTSMVSDSSAVDSDSGLMDSDSNSDSDSQWVQWEMYKANLDFYVQQWPK